MNSPNNINYICLCLIIYLIPNIIFGQDKLSLIIDDKRKNVFIENTSSVEKDYSLGKDELLVTFDSITNKEYEIGLPFTIKDDFIQGLKSPHEDNRWIYASRENRKTPTDLYFYNRQSDSRKMIIRNDQTPDPLLSYIPFAFSHNPDIIYVEAEDYIKGRYHLGIYKVNLLTKEFEQVDIPSNYMSTPLINKNRDKLYFTATTEKTRNFVHGTSDLLFKYDLMSQTNTIVKDNNGKNLVFEGFNTQQFKGIPLPNVIPPCQAPWTVPENIFETVPIVLFRIPYAEGKHFCTGRLGTIPPCNNGQGFNKCNHGPECDHSNSPHNGVCTPRGLTDVYIAADMTSNDYTNSGDRPIYAAAIGEVSLVRNDAAGYGLYVEVEHPNGLFTQYAHLDEIYVIEGQDVCPNTVLGKEGSTGGVTGRHLHFEVRVASGCRGSEYVRFIDASNSGLNYGDSGSTVTKSGCAPIPSFASNQDYEPRCGSIQLNSSNNNLLVSNLAVANLGDALGDSFKIKYFAVDGTVEYYLGFQQMSGLLAENVALMPNFSLNTSSIPNGSYFLKVRIDADNLAGNENPLLAEYNLNNNECTSSVTFSAGTQSTCFDNIQNQGELDVDCGGPCPACSPQVNLKSLSCATPILNGTDLQVLYEISNLGSSSSGTFWVGFFAYKLGDNNPYHLASMDTQHSSINGNTSQTFLKVVDVNTAMTAAGLTEGEYKIGVYSDFYSSINESNESDNFCVHDSYFTYSNSNLTHTASCLTTQISGEYLNVYFDIINQGGSATGIIDYQLFIWDNQTSQGYTLGNTYSVGSVPANGTESVAAGFHLESEMAAHGLSPGFYELGLSIDYSDLEEETNETDNTCLSATSFEYTGGCNSTNGVVQGYWGSTFEINAPNFLIAPGSGNQCIVGAPDGDLTLQAGGYIELNPGFLAEDGSHFLASIGDCSDINNFIADEIEKELAKEDILTKSPKDQFEDAELFLNVEENKEYLNNAIDQVNYFTVNPNPFTDITTVSYSLDSSDIISLSLINIDGKTVRVIEQNVHKNNGTHVYDLARDNLISGTYILKLKTSNQVLSKKIFIAK